MHKALLSHRTIDRWLRNTARRWTLQDFIDASSNALYECEGKQDPEKQGRRLQVEDNRGAGVGDGC